MKYIAEIALNKEGIITEQEFEIKLPATLAEVESQEHEMFHYLRRLWDAYCKSDLCVKGLYHFACDFSDWVRENLKFKETCICWTASRNVSKAHITIKRQ